MSVMISHVYKQEVFMKNISKVYIGVDVSKKSLDIHFLPCGKFFKIANSDTEIKKAIKEFSKHENIEIGCESTGGYEKLFKVLLLKNNHHLRVIDPRRIKGFIISSGFKSKTDKSDAKKIAEFISKNPKEYDTIQKTENEELLQALVNRKNDLTKFLTSEKTRLKSPSHEICLSNIKDFVKYLTLQIKKLDKNIQDLIKKDTVLNKKSIFLESIPGIGKSTAAALLSFVPELGKISNGKISALVGVCPYDNESGNFRGKKFIKGGRIIPRKMLYMCAITAIKYNPPLKTFYDRLIAANKPFKIAIVAIMHKLIIIANSILKKGELCKS
jgi:transposase